MGMSPMIWIPRSFAYFLSAVHCTRKRNCNKRVELDSACTVRGASSSDWGSRVRISSGQSCQETPRYRSFNARKNAKSCSQEACAISNALNCSRSSADPCRWNDSESRRSASLLNAAAAAKSTSYSLKPRESPPVSRPRKARPSMEIRSGLPANADSAE